MSASRGDLSNWGPDFGSFHVHLEKNLTCGDFSPRATNWFFHVFPTRQGARTWDLESYLSEKNWVILRVKL